MFKLARLILSFISLSSTNLFFSSEALAQSVGVKECHITGEKSLSKILQASLSLSSKGYLITIKEKNTTQLFGLTRDFRYYYDSSNFFFLEVTSPAKISSDGSFLLIVSAGAKSGCIFKGKLVFDVGVKEQLFPKNDIAFCKDAITRAEITIEKANASIFEVEKLRHHYKDHPKNLDFMYSFPIMGRGAGNVINSPVLLKSISTNIVANCKDIGMVRFGIYGTDDARSFGLLNNGKVQEFKCIASGAANPPWGSEHCAGFSF